MDPEWDFDDLEGWCRKGSVEHEVCSKGMKMLYLFICSGRLESEWYLTEESGLVC